MARTRSHRARMDPAQPAHSARMYGGSMDADLEPGGTFAVRARLPL